MTAAPSSAQMSGSLVQRALDQGKANAGTGGYLQVANVARRPGGDQWLVNGAPLEPARAYRVAINDFLLSGFEAKLEYLTRESPDVSAVAEARGDPAGRSWPSCAEAPGAAA